MSNPITKSTKLSVKTCFFIFNFYLEFIDFAITLHLFDFDVSDVGLIFSVGLFQ